MANKNKSFTRENNDMIVRQGLATVTSTLLSGSEALKCCPQNSTYL